MTSFAAARALSWEYYRLARRAVPLVTLAGCSLAGLYWIALEPFGERRDTLVFSTVFMTLLIVHGMALLNCRSEGLALGFERRLYRLPVSTTGLVVWRLLPAVLAGALMYLGTAGFMLWMTGARWPLLGPTLVAVTFLVWTLALNWSLGRRPYLLAPVGLPLAALFFSWLKPRFEARGSDVMANWQDFGVSDASLLSVLSLLGVAVAVAFVRADRAEPRNLQSLMVSARFAEAGGAERATIREAVSFGRGRPDFGSATRAQLWMEWREKGRWLVLWSVCGVSIGLLAGGFPEFETGPMLRTGLLFMALLLFLAPAFAGFLHGRSDLSSRSTMLDRLRATRPLSDAKLARTLLQATFLTTLGSWLAAFSTLGLFTGGALVWGDSEKVTLILEGVRQAFAHSAAFDLALVLVLVLAFGVGTAGLMLSVVVSGRNWLAESLAAPYVLVILGLVLERAAGLDQWRRLLPFLGLGMVILAPLVTVVCAWLCYRRGHYTLRPLVRGSLLYLSLSTILVLRFPFLQQALAPGELPLERAVALAAPAALSGAFLPFVLAPLMLSWNRHR